MKLNEIKTLSLIELKIIEYRQFNLLRYNNNINDLNITKYAIKDYYKNSFYKKDNFYKINNIKDIKETELSKSLLELRN